MYKKILLVICILFFGLILGIMYRNIVTAKRDSTSSSNTLGLRLVTNIPLTGDTNRWDYQSINYANQRLYISHLGSNMVSVFDLKNNKIIKNIALSASPYGILVVPSLHTVYVGVGGNNTVAVIDEESLAVSKYIPAGDTPDGLEYDPFTKKVFVSDETGGTVTIIDASKNERIGDIPVGGRVGNTHFDSVSKKIYVVSGQDNTLVEIDPAKNNIINKYATSGCSIPHGFYIEEKTHYAFITCQGNNKMVVFDLSAKKIMYTDTVGPDPDVLAFDPNLHHLYVAAESGELAIFSLQKNKISKLGQGFIAEKAHTISVDKNTHKMYFPLENINGKSVLRIYEPF